MCKDEATLESSIGHVEGIRTTGINGLSKDLAIGYLSPFFGRSQGRGNFTSLDQQEGQDRWRES